MPTYNYRSKFEGQVGKFLEMHGVKFEYEPYDILYKRRVQSGECSSCPSKVVFQRKTYTPDFVLPELGIILEVKGLLSATDRAKMLAVKENNPQLDIRFVFMSNNKVKKSNAEYRYSDWASEHGFPYGVKTIPVDWFTRR